MKPNSRLVVLVLAQLGATSVSDINQTKINGETVKLMADEMTQSAQVVLADLFEQANQTSETAFLSSDDIRWKDAGFGLADEDMRAIVACIYRHYGHSVLITSEGLTVSKINRKAA